MDKLHAIYFSATDTTRKCVGGICHGIGFELTTDINLADKLDVELPEFHNDDVVVVGAPVYGGRLPGLVAEALKKLKGNGASAVALVVFGNRDYDDALLELNDILSATGFRVVGAGAFAAQHSIFPRVAAGRPDAADIEQLARFGESCRKALAEGDYPALDIKGNHPYKNAAGVPLRIELDESKCLRCGICASKCPVDAISTETFRTDAAICINCGRCISVCTKKVRGYKGVKYALIRKVFEAGFSKRKEPEWTVAKRP